MVQLGSAVASDVDDEGDDEGDGEDEGGAAAATPADALPCSAKTHAHAPPTASTRATPTATPRDG